LTLSRSADLLIAVTIGVASVAIGSGAATTLRDAPGRAEYSGFSQRVYGAALMRACGHGEVSPAGAVLTGNDERFAPLREFVAGHRDAIDCAVTQSVPSEPLDGLQRASRYLLMLVAAPWMLSGPAWSGIDVVMGLLFAVTIVLAFAACRLTMGRVAAVGAASLFALSPLHLRHLEDVRDYSKAPFFLLALAVVALLVMRRLPGRVVVGVAAGTGALLGLGFGMRTDVAISVAVVVGVVLVFLPGGVRSTWKTRLVAAVACVAAFWVVSLPLVSSFETRSSPWHVSLLGFAHDWDGPLGVSDAPYETGYFYDDSYVGTLIDAYWGRVSGGEAQVAVGLPGYAAASREYFLALVSTFPADMAARVAASAIRVIQLPFSAAASNSSLLTAPLSSLSELAQQSLARLEAVSLPAFLVMMLCLSAVCLRRATLVFVLALVLGGYPALQFQPRHVFHLEIIGLWALMLCVSALVAMVMTRVRLGAPRALQRSRWRPAVFAATVTAVLFLPIAALRAHQQPKVERLIESYLSAPSETIATANGLVLVGRDRLFTDARGGRSIYSELLTVDIAEGCSVPSVAVTFRYQRTTARHDFSRTYEVDAARGGGARLFVPVFETGSATPDAHRLRFEGIEVMPDEHGCVRQVGRVRTPDQFALLLPVVITPDWRSSRWYEQLREWEQVGESAIRLTRWSPAELAHRRAVVLQGAAAAPPFSAAVEYASRIATIDRGAVYVDGYAESAGSYLVAWAARRFDSSTVIVGEGRIERGGVSIGLVDASGWATRVDIAEPGPFRAAVQPATAGDYQLVIANYLPGGSLKTRLNVSKLAIATGISPAAVAQ